MLGDRPGAGSRAPQVIAYWLTSSSIARQAASLSTWGAGKSGIPCARLTASYFSGLDRHAADHALGEPRRLLRDQRKLHQLTTHDRGHTGTLQTGHQNPPYPPFVMGDGDFAADPRNNSRTNGNQRQQIMARIEPGTKNQIRHPNLTFPSDGPLTVNISDEPFSLPSRSG